VTLQDKARTQRFYGAFARAYDRLAPLFSGTKSVRAKYWNEFDLDETDRVLDLGCGTDISTNEALDRAGAVDGVDITPAQVRQAAGKDVLHDARFVVGDAERLPYAGDTFDAVVSIGVVPFLPDPVAAFSEAHRVTRDGGRLLVVGAHRPTNPLYAWLSEQVASVLSESELATTLEIAGWSAVETRVVKMDWLLRNAVVGTARVEKSG
jgi:demethylmenaquinone methyltransferase/2-methoxy-6-polyprenyl-1,4-benzoquinol methylase